MSSCSFCGRRDGFAPVVSLLLRANRMLWRLRRESGKLFEAARLSEAKFKAERVLREEAEAANERLRDLVVALEAGGPDWAAWERSLGSDGGSG